MTSLSLLKQLLSMNLIVMVVFIVGVKILIFIKEHACSFVACIVKCVHQALSRTKKRACLVSSKGNMMQPGPLIMLQYT